VGEFTLAALFPVVTTRAIKLRPVTAIEFRPLAKWSVTAGPIALHAISRVAIAIPRVAVAIPVARTRETRALVTTTVVTRTIETRFVETRPCAAIVTVATLALLPRLGFAVRWPIAEILARAALGIGPLLAIAVSAGVRLPVPEFAILESSGRTGLAAVAEVALGPRRTIVAIEARAIPAWLEIALLAASALIPVSPRRAVVAAEAFRTALTALKTARPVFSLAAAEGTILTVFLETRLVAVTFKPLRPKAAFGELLVRPAWLARAALAAERAVAPSARSVVFIVVAGHERAR
jgi:hypothetical protein